jgi:hypothetical protein
MREMMRHHAFHLALLPLRAELYFAGACCSLATNSTDVIASLARWSAPDGSCGPAIELHVIADTAAERHVDAPMHFRGLNHLVFALISPNEFFVFDLLRRRVSGVVSPETARDAEFWSTRMVPLILGIMGVTVGIVPLHCACLDLEGEGLLLAGKSLAGKSTLAVALSKRGFALISDGWTYLARDARGELVARGISAPVKLLPDAVNHFPELRGYKSARAFNGEIAIEVDASLALNATMLCESRPRRLVLLERSQSARSKLERLPADAVREFFLASVDLMPPPLDGFAVSRAALITQLSRIECWKMHHGGSPQEAAEIIRSLYEGSLSNHVRRCAIS